MIWHLCVGKLFSFKISQFKVGKKTEKPPSTDDDADIYLPGSRLLRRQRRTAVSNTRHRTRRGRSSGEQEAFTSENYYFDKKQQPRSLPYRLPILILPTFEEWVCKKMTNGRSKNESPNKWLTTWWMAGRISETSTRSRLLWTRRRKNLRKKTMTASADRGRKKKWRKTLLNVSMMMVLDVDDGDGFFPL